MRLALVIAQLECGGAERVLTRMANYWANAGFQVSIFTFASPEEKSFFPLDRSIKVIGLNTSGVENAKGRSLSKVFHCVFNFRKEIKLLSPDVIISFIDITNVFTILFSIGLKVPVIVSERTDPAQWKIGRILSLVRRLCYPWAGKVVVQTERARSYFGARQSRTCVVIPNPIEAVKIEKRCHDGSRPCRIVSFGRLVNHKGFDILIKAFSEVSNEYPNWNVHIFGDGPERSNLLALISDKGLSDRVFLEGRTDNVNHQMAHADLFVLPSLFEGFPNALCEAMAAGLPVVSFDCPSGPREIIRNGIDGLLVSPIHVASLRESLRVILYDEGMRKRLAEAAPQILTRFGIEAVMRQWTNLIMEVTHKK